LKRLGVPAAKAKPFIVLPDFHPRDDAIISMRSTTALRGLSNTPQLDLQV
jgi:hypothetical protein